MTVEDILETLVSKTYIKRHLLPVGCTKERKGEEIKIRIAAHFSAVQMKKWGKN